MYIRIARQRQGKKEYRSLQIAESFRDPEKGGAPRTRILAHLGRVEKVGGGGKSRRTELANFSLPRTSGMSMLSARRGNGSGSPPSSTVLELPEKHPSRRRSWCG
jgi:hypothetical protein